MSKPILEASASSANTSATQVLVLKTLQEHIAQTQISKSSKQLLVLTDDFAPTLFSQLANDTAIVLSNRFDTISSAKDAGLRTYLNDFDFPKIDEDIDCVFFRLAKEKSLSNHIINHALQQLKPKARLFIIGEKKEGVKGYADKIKKLLGLPVHIKKHGLSYVISATKTKDDLENLLPTQNYTDVVAIENTHNIKLNSKPGVFAWSKIDAGSAFLNDELDTWLSRFKRKPESLLDLGCGYGYLAVMGLKRDFSYVHATDSNIIATELCRQNLLLNNNSNNASKQHSEEEGSTTRIEVSCDDCGQAIKERFHCIISNPPFHRGFQHDQELTLKFLKQCKRLLKNKGRVLLVVNEFLAVEKMALDFFNHVEVVASNKTYKLIELAHG